MNKVGIDDVLVANGPQVLPRLLSEAWRFDGRPCPTKVHLSEIEDATLARRRLAIDLMVSAVGESYLLPLTIELQCARRRQRGRPRLHLVAADGEPVEDEGESQDSESPPCSHLGESDGRWEVEISSPELLIELTRISSRNLRRRLHEFASSLCPNAHFERTVTKQTITSLLATPQARRLRAAMLAGGPEVVDSAGRPFRAKVLFYRGKLEEASRYFRGVGVAIPNPKTQEATAFLWSLTPLADEFEDFTVSEGFLRKVAVFRAQAGQAWQTLLNHARDVTDHITNIYGEHRRLALLGKLLTFHSIRQFRFDGELLKRGWVEMLEVGDTGQGKTQQVDRLQQATGMGEGVDGVSTTRTGLAYSFQKLNDAWFLVWGKYPLNDCKLLFIDEAQNLNAEDVDKIRKGRSDGVVAADGVRSGEHPSRTRLIMTCNPKQQGVVDDQLFGIELVKQTFKDEDIRRFDFAIISSSSDEKANINSPRSKCEVVDRRISDEVLAASVKWAWSRRSDQVIFTEEAIRAVYDTARDLTAIYGEARDIPLVLESDARHKVARLAAAVAALLHSTDEPHERVIVEKEHIGCVRTFLNAIYRHTNCSFELYASLRKAEAGMSESEYETIWRELRECEVDSFDHQGQERPIRLSETDLSTLLRSFLTHHAQISRQDLAGELGKSTGWTSKVVRVLKGSRLIRVTKGKQGGYQATPKFIRFLKLALAKGDLEA